MLELELYCFRRTASADFFATLASGHLATGETVKIDGVDGFLDENFERRGIGNHFFMLPVPSLNAIPVRTADLDSLPVLEVRIVEPHIKHPQVRVELQTTLGSWMRSSTVGAYVPTAAMPVGDLREVLDALIEEAELTRAASWVRSTDTPGSREEIRALYVVSSDSSPRCLILRTNAAASQLFALDETRRG